MPPKPSALAVPEYTPPDVPTLLVPELLVPAQLVPDSTVVLVQTSDQAQPLVLPAILARASNQKNHHSCLFTSHHFDIFFKLYAVVIFLIN
jgi:hypothetical protein